MNAPATIPHEAIATIEEFEDMCWDYVGWWRDGILDKTVAVDSVQRHAEIWGMVDQIGQDDVQRMMAEAFMPLPELPSDYAQQLIKRWELDDPRDRWQHTGEPPPATEVRSGPIGPAQANKVAAYQTPQSTIDAFLYVAALDDVPRLKAWLDDHPKDAPMLLALLESKLC